MLPHSLQSDPILVIRFRVVGAGRGRFLEEADRSGEIALVVPEQIGHPRVERVLRAAAPRYHRVEESVARLLALPQAQVQPPEAIPRLRLPRLQRQRALECGHCARTTAP